MALQWVAQPDYIHIKPTIAYMYSYGYIAYRLAETDDDSKDLFIAVNMISTLVNFGQLLQLFELRLRKKVSAGYRDSFNMAILIYMHQRLSYIL